MIGPGHLQLAVAPSTAQQVLVRTFAALGARGQMGLDLLEGAAALADRLAAAAPPALADGNELIELTLLADNGAMEISVRGLAPGGGAAMLADQVSELCTLHTCAIGPEADRLAMLIADGPSGGTVGSGRSVVREEVWPDGPVVISVNEDLDIASAPGMRLAARTALIDGAPSLVLDLTQVKFVDSSGVGALIAVVGLLGDERPAALVTADSVVRRALEMTGLNEMLRVCADLDQARGMFRGVWRPEVRSDVMSGAASAPGLEITTVSRGRTTWVTVQGELDVATARDLDAVLLTAERQAETDEVQLDLLAVTFIDSSGMQAIVEAARRDQGKLTIHPSEAVARVIELSGLANRLPIAG